MRTPRIPSDLLDPVVEFFKPQRVILFGSRARGEATRDSDIDLLVIVDDDAPPEKLNWRDGLRAYRSKRDAEADADGIVVYGSAKGSRMKAPDPRDRWEAVNDWLAVANEERRVAGIC